MPMSALSSRIWLGRGLPWAEPGRALEEAVEEIGKRHFPALHMVPGALSQPLGLLLDMDPRWAVKGGKVELVISYNIFGPDGSRLHSGETRGDAPCKPADFNTTALALATATVHQAMEQAKHTLDPNATKFPANGRIA